MAGDRLIAMVYLAVTGAGAFLELVAVPSAMTVPWSMTMIRSLSVRPLREWVVNSVAMPAVLKRRRDPRYFAYSSIKPGGRFVQKHHIGADHQATADVYPPTHPTRIGANTPIRRINRSNSRMSSVARVRAADLLSPCSRPNITKFSCPVRSHPPPPAGR